MKENDLYSVESLENIFQYTQCIALFVSDRKHFFVFSDKEYFELNIKISFDNYLKEGIINNHQYNQYANYRGGIWQLTKNNFEQFLALDDVLTLEQSDLKKLLFYGFDSHEQQRLYDILQNQLAFNMGINHDGELSDFKKINQISSRLPLFYINFDTNVYLHMNWDRLHEDYAYEHWFAKAMDFGYLIPDEYCYWKVDGKDYWKTRQI